MTILQILPELKSGGVERGTVDFAKYLQTQGHRSIVISAGGPLVKELEAAGVIHYKLPVQKKSPITVFKSVSLISKIVKKEGVEIIHARSRVPALIAYFVSRNTAVPFITTCHGYYRKHLMSRIMGWGKRVIVGSHIIGRHMRDDFGVPHHKIRLIARGVDLSEFQYKPYEAGKPMVVGMVGRLTPIKGHPLFLKAMARVARVFPNVKIQIIGDSPRPQYKEELMVLMRRLGLANNVEFMGTRYDIPQIMSNLSVLVVPSVGEEAFGRVAIEAGACGVPVVATRMGGLVDIIENEKDGILVPSDDPRLMSEAVIRLLKEPELAAALSTALRQKVEQKFAAVTMFEKTLKVYEETIEQKKILVIKVSAVGDVILCIPSLRALRQAYPKAWITVLVGRKSRKFIRNCPYVNDMIVLEDYTGKERAAHFLKTARLLAKEDFDVVVDLQNNRISHALGFLSGARVRAGHDNRRWSFLLNKRARGGDGLAISPLDHQFRVLRLLGIEPTQRNLELWTQKEEEARVRQFLESQWVSPSQILVGINPGSSLRWQTKQWPLEYFARLCDELAKRNIRVVITGAPEDQKLLAPLFEMTKNKPISAIGKTSVTELVALVKRCQVFISSDSAPMHIASSVDVPLVAIFGPTDPKKHLVPPTHCQVFWKEISCSPCYLRSCPIGHICMKKIQPQEILDAVLYFLKETRQKRGTESNKAAVNEFTF